jgi:hypothetical protein
MPFKSEVQRRKFYAMAERGEIPMRTVKRWESATGPNVELPERVKNMPRSAADFIPDNHLVPFPAKGKAAPHGAALAQSPRPSPPQNAGAAHRVNSTQNAAKTNKTNAAKRYTSAHWGKDAEKTFNYPNEPNMPDVLVEMGKLVELHIDATGKSQGHKKAKHDYELTFPRSVHLAFATTADERLYIALPKREKQANKGLLTDDGIWFNLTELADFAPGRQTEFTYPRVQVQCLGVVTHVVYATEKEGDGPSEYIHAFGEETGTKPLLGVDEDGGLWFAGGNYSVPDEGITD